MGTILACKNCRWRGQFKDAVKEVSDIDGGQIVKCPKCNHWAHTTDWYADKPNESGWYWVNNLIYKNKYYDGEFLVPIVVRFVKEHNSIYVLHTNYEEVLRFDVDMDITCEWSDKINPPIDVWEIDVKNYVVPVNTK